MGRCIVRAMTAGPASSRPIDAWIVACPSCGTVQPIDALSCEGCRQILGVPALPEAHPVRYLPTLRGALTVRPPVGALVLVVLLVAPIGVFAAVTTGLVSIAYTIVADAAAVAILLYALLRVPSTVAAARSLATMEYARLIVLAVVGELIGLAGVFVGAFGFFAFERASGSSGTPAPLTPFQLVVVGVVSYVIAALIIGRLIYASPLVILGVNVRRAIGRSWVLTTGSTMACASLYLTGSIPAIAVLLLIPARTDRPLILQAGVSAFGLIFGVAIQTAALKILVDEDAQTAG
jgi:hypothetical protein